MSMSSEDNIYKDRQQMWESWNDDIQWIKTFYPGPSLDEKTKEEFVEFLKKDGVRFHELQALTKRARQAKTGLIAREAQGELINILKTEFENFSRQK